MQTRIEGFHGIGPKLEMQRSSRRMHLLKRFHWQVSEEAKTIIYHILQLNCQTTYDANLQSLFSSIYWAVFWLFNNSDQDTSIDNNYPGNKHYSHLFLCLFCGQFNKISQSATTK